MKKLIALICCVFTQVALASDPKVEIEGIDFAQVPSAGALVVSPHRLTFDIDTFMTTVDQLKTMHINPLTAEIAIICVRTEEFNLIAKNFNIWVVARALKENKADHLLYFLRLIAESGTVNSLSLLRQINTEYLTSTDQNKTEFEASRSQFAKFETEFNKIMTIAIKSGLKVSFLEEDARALEASMAIHDVMCTDRLTKKTWFKNPFSTRR